MGEEFNIQVTEPQKTNKKTVTVRKELLHDTS